jgi:antitoxin CptB
MTGTTRTSEGLDPRRRRLLYRAWHRGIREMDLIVGRFADAWIDKLDDQELDALEHLMGAPDQALYSWISGEKPVPAEYDTAMFRRVRAFNATGTG